MAKILCLSSEVLSGAIGNAIAKPVLGALGHEVLAVPTIVLPYHPGHGPSDPKVTSSADLERHLTQAGNPDAILTGYFAEAEQVEIAARWIREQRAQNPGLTYICDPIMGDNSALYVPEGVAAAMKAQLMPLADIITPNRFELEVLSGRKLVARQDIIRAAQSLAPSLVLCSSALSQKGALFSLLISSSEEVEIANERFVDVPHGTGDLLTALFAGHLLNNETPHDAFSATIEQVDLACKKSAGQKDLRLDDCVELIKLSRS